jgi:hypothetical protein
MEAQQAETGSLFLQQAWFNPQAPVHVDWYVVTPLAEDPLKQLPAHSNIELAILLVSYTNRLLGR